MKRVSRALAAILLITFLLSGCTCLIEDKTVTCDGLSMTLPGLYVNLSEQEYAAEFDFVYGFKDEAVLGFQQDRASLDASFSDLNARKYAELFVEAAELTSTVTEQDGLVLFDYTATADNVDVTYLCSVYMSDTSFWVIQFYCPTEDYAENKSDFLSYLQSVQV